jgi:ABC-type transport system involved in cytochrome c biogenesis permease subunit
LAEVLFWPALVAYGEAVVAYAGNTRRPGQLGRLATWGVRIGWLVQTALLAAQAVEADGFPWGTWAGSLNLFVWLVVGVYLAWGCRPRYRLLGLAVMPLAAILLVLAYAAGGMEGQGSDYSTLFLVAHVGLVLAALAGFTLAAGLAGIYLWQEGRLKRHRAAGLLRLGAPSLVSLDVLAARIIAFAFPALTLGIAAGLIRLSTGGGSVDALAIAGLATWGVYGAFLLLRLLAGWRGRRSARLALAAFALVATLLLLALVHA